MEETFTDYPMLTQGNPLSENGFPQVGFQSIYNAWSEVNSMIASGELTPATATQHFPNWAGVADPDPVASLNFGIYGGAEYNAYDLTSAINYFTEVMDANGIAPWQVAFTLLECEGLEPEPEPDPTFAWTGNICDYPLLVSSAGVGTSGVFGGFEGGQADVVDIDDIQEVYNNVLDLMNLPESNSAHITGAEATFLFPDINGDGTIGVADLQGVLALNWNTADLIFCGEPLPYTGNLCDYPWLFDADGYLSLESIQVYYTYISYENVTYFNLGSPAYSTWMFPDFNNDGIISIGDYIALVNGTFFMGDSTVNCTETPPGITKPSLKKRAMLAKAAKALAEEVIPKEEIQKQIKKLKNVSR